MMMMMRLETIIFYSEMSIVGVFFLVRRDRSIEEEEKRSDKQLCCFDILFGGEKKGTFAEQSVDFLFM
jgi:hypothetical protein